MQESVKASIKNGMNKIEFISRFQIITIYTYLAERDWARKTRNHVFIFKLAGY